MNGVHNRRIRLLSFRCVIRKDHGDDIKAVVEGGGGGANEVRKTADKDEGRSEARNGGGRSRRRRRDGHGVMADEQPSGHSQWATPARKTQ